MLAFFLLAAVLPPTLASDVFDLYWNITYVENVNPSGLHARRAIGVNGFWPPPPVSVKQNDVLRIHVNNQLDIGMALHSHGVLYEDAPFYDGVVGVTQW